MSAIQGMTPTAIVFQEPIRFDEASFNRMMVACVDAGSSDVTIRSGRRVVAHISGRLVPVTERALEFTEVEVIAQTIYGPNAMTEIRSGRPIDPSYEIRPDKLRALRFRVNATGTFANGRDGLEITIRTIPTDPPSLTDLGIEQEIIDNFVHPQGLVFVSGPTGSGKSTLLAAGIRMLLEDADSHRKIITYESPIEFTYTRYDEESTAATISQSELPRHIEGGFAAAARNAVRRAPSVILFGECRDTETISSVMEAANTGHMIYTTLHSLGVGKSLMRVAELFQNPEERLQMMKVAIECMRMIVSQCLVRRADRPGRIALREWLVFTPEIQEELLWLNDPLTIIKTARNMVKARGNDMETRVEKLYRDGIIAKSEYLKYRPVGEKPIVSVQKPALDPSNEAGKPVAQQTAGEAAHVA